MRTYDVAVVGLGAMGSFTCLDLARRGLQVIGLDQFAPPHNRGSHSGDTRVFRTAYAEYPDYVPLAQRAGELWDHFSQDFGVKLLTRCGMLMVGPPWSQLIAGTRASVAAHKLQVEELSPDEIRYRFPAFTPPEDHTGIFEASAGWVDVDASIRGALQAARQKGAEILCDTSITCWKRSGASILLETTAGTFSVAKLIITVGAWAGALLRDLQLPLSVQVKTLAWVDPITPEQFAPSRFPVFAIAERFFYGFPNIGGKGVKLAVHWESGTVLPDPSNPVSQPGEGELAPIVSLASRYFSGLTNAPPGGLASIRRAAACLYTMTPDEHFIIDHHPASEDIWFAAGFSGHGFKFAPAIAQGLADLCTSSKTPLPMKFLRIGRRFVTQVI